MSYSNYRAKTTPDVLKMLYNLLACYEFYGRYYVDSCLCFAEKFIHTSFPTYCGLYHVARGGTIVQRAVQFVYHMCILRLVDVLLAQ